MNFDNEFIESIQEDPAGSVVEIVSQAECAVDQQSQGSWTDDEYNMVIEAYSLLISVMDSFDLAYPDAIPKLTGNPDFDGAKMLGFMSICKQHFQKDVASSKLDKMIGHHKRLLGSVFVYEFSDGDVDRIQTLINELREEISTFEKFDDGHRSRLLKRLETLQSELHKKMSDVDRFWGLVGEAGVVLGKFGKDSKPFVDRIREIADIVWRTQSRAEELPSGSKPPLIESEDV